MWKHLIWITIWILVGASFAGMIRRWVPVLPEM
jgi:hypothetical protein